MEKDRLKEITELAAAYGFTDAQIAPWGAGSVLVLFSKYAPSGVRDPDRICISAYYPASNRAHKKAGQLTEELNKRGIPAIRDSSLPARGAALATGGCIGKNGFYYHPQFGSLVHIQTILLEEITACPPHEIAGECLGCGRCAAACPCGAIGDMGVDISKCVRKAMDGDIQDEMKPFVYQLYGCELCQSACPMNAVEKNEGDSFDLIATIKGETLHEIQNLTGKNIARLVRTVNQAVAYAANVGNRAVLPAVLALLGDDRFTGACRYYLNELKKKD